MSYTYTVTAHSQASPAAVFDALLRPGTWPSWSPIEAAEVEGDGDPGDRQEVGDVRIFRIGGNAAREHITGLVPDRKFHYENPGKPFRSYHGTVELSEAPRGGTDITWRADTVWPRTPERRRTRTRLPERSRRRCPSFAPRPVLGRGLSGGRRTMVAGCPLPVRNSP
ncbi:SRPBCC family protein [Streptomyces aureocirculatus]|uniref:SRPBCC family protein n=1 Tax=Streptomyces aureocirculatus TaxID=67275 RepID=UPI00068B5524|nr:SRPBCC family protein [Streptomyces aureocirculatus]